MGLNMHVDEQYVWQYLRVEPVANDESPPSNEPVDADFIRTLIENAEKRVETFIGSGLDELDAIPADLVQVIHIDVACNYWNRLAPDLPEAYWSLLMPYRVWSFGRAIPAGDDA